MEKLYSNFKFTGKLGFNDLLKDDKITKRPANEWNGASTERDNGVLKNTIFVDNNGNENQVRNEVNLFIEANGTREYLKFNETIKIGKVNTVGYRAEGDTTTTRIDESKASNEEIVQNCVDYMKLKLSIGEIKFETLSKAHMMKKLYEVYKNIKGREVTITGSIRFSTSKDGKLYVNYEAKNIRDKFENEEDGLFLDVNAVYTKGHVKAPSFDIYSGMGDRPKVPMNILIPVQKYMNDQYVDKLVNVSDKFFMDIPKIDDEGTYGIIKDMFTKDVIGNELEDYKYYTTTFKVNIVGLGGKKTLTESDLTFQEKNMLAVNMKTMEQIMKERPQVGKTDKVMFCSPVSQGGIKLFEVANGDVLSKNGNTSGSVNVSDIKVAPTPISTPPIPTGGIGININGLPKM